MELLVELAVGAFLISLTSSVHILGIVGLVRIVDAWKIHQGVKHGYGVLLEVLIISVVGLFLLHTAEIWVWAAFYRFVGEFAELHRALYFSTVTFSTLGYGDITLSDRWQLVGSFEAVNGVILFGISTAFLIAVIQKSYVEATENKDLH